MAKPTPKPDDPAQSKRFIELAEEFEIEGTPDAFERAFKRVATAPRKTVPPKPKRKKR